MSVASTSPPESGRRHGWVALLPVGYALVVTLEFGLRYGYRWSETDTSQFSQFTRNILAQHTITPKGGNVYPHGFGFQAIAATLTMVTGLDVAQVLQIVLPFLAVVTALLAFVTFRRLTGSAVLGSLAALLLFVQPEFLFVTERGNHEKVTDALMLALVFLLVVSFQSARDIRTAIELILAFYLCAWAQITVNAFFASSFMASLGLSLAAGLGLLLLIHRRSSRSEGIDTFRRLGYTILSCFALIFAFVAYIYIPAQYNFGVVHTLLQRLALLFLSFEPKGVPYATIDTGWVNPWVYLILTAFNWTILALAAITWVWLGLRFRRRGLRAEERHLLLLWLLAAAFAIEVGASILADFSGFLGSNLQVRLFPLFMLFGIPLAVIGVANAAKRLRSRSWQHVAAVVLAAVIAVFAATSVLKATSDPLLSNKWLFYTANEQRAVVWAEGHISEQSIWAGFDERLRTMAELHPAPRSNGDQLTSGSADAAAHYLIMSDIIQRQSLRVGVPAPDLTGADRIYDDGSAQIYHRVPQTPYQP